MVKINQVSQRSQTSKYQYSFLMPISTKTIAILILTSFIFFSNCKKNKDAPTTDNDHGLPNATQTGADIFACRINDQNFISLSGIYNMGGKASADTLFCFGAIKGSDYFENLIVTINGWAAQGKDFQLTQNGNNTIRLSTNRNCKGNLGSNVYNANAISGTCHISAINKIKNIISGSFNCKIPVTDCDTLVVTEGRFDIQF